MRRSGGRSPLNQTSGMPKPPTGNAYNNSYIPPEVGGRSSSNFVAEGLRGWSVTSTTVEPRGISFDQSFNAEEVDVAEIFQGDEGSV